MSACWTRLLFSPFHQVQKRLQNDLSDALLESASLSGLRRPLPSFGQGIRNAVLLPRYVIPELGLGCFSSARCSIGSVSF